jgi:hypothetical protein
VIRPATATTTSSTTPKAARTIHRIVLVSVSLERLKHKKDKSKSVLFLKKKQQKDFYQFALGPNAKLRDGATHANEQEFFASFLQKRRPSLIFRPTPCAPPHSF